MESSVCSHQVRSNHRELPLEPEVPFAALVGVATYDWNKEGARLDLFADHLIPNISAPQLALVEPDFDVGSPQGGADSFSRRASSDA